MFQQWSAGNLVTQGPDRHPAASLPQHEKSIYENKTCLGTDVFSSTACPEFPQKNLYEHQVQDN